MGEGHSYLDNKDGTFSGDSGKDKTRLNTTNEKDVQGQGNDKQKIKTYKSKNENQLKTGKLTIVNKSDNRLKSHLQKNNKDENQNHYRGYCTDDD